jgi:hypothetical protein
MNRTMRALRVRLFVALSAMSWISYGQALLDARSLGTSYGRGPYVIENLSTFGEIGSPTHTLGL